MDEEALKKNTDCVYFLASPLTCKKGSECEFRHSESARVNPRDCRYWLAGNCLNWDCPFRHPPLEGRPAIAAAGQSPAGASKARVPCYFFSQGYCAKGDKCPFMHSTPSSSASKPSGLQRPPRVTPPNAAEGSDKKAANSSGNGTPPKPSIEQPSEIRVAAEFRPAPAGGVQVSPLKEGRSIPIATAVTQNGGTRGRAEGAGASALFGSRLRLRQVQSADERVQNGLEPEEWWGEESSPGFDVLVDDGPEQSRYPDDPEFQSAHEAGMEPGKPGSGGRGRSRAMHMAEDIEQFDYEYPSSYDHSSAYDTGGQYDHGAYDYSVHDQQMAYDPSNAYDRIGHQRAVAYGDRGAVGDVLPRERLGLGMDGDVRVVGAGNDHRTRIVKRRRGDGGQQHLPESQSRRQRTEVPLEEYQQHQRQQEDQQKLMELQLRNQLFIQHGMRNSNRRPHEKVMQESGGVARRALQDIGTEAPHPMLERVVLKNTSKGRSNDYARTGMKDVELSRNYKASESGGEAEAKMSVDSELNRKGEHRKEPSSFAGPKTLAQIRAEKRKGGSEEALKGKEVTNGSRKAQESGAPKVFGARGLNQSISTPVAEAALSEMAGAEERKIRLGKVVSHEPKKAPTFEGPKSLSAILKEKRKNESETEAKEDESGKDATRRISSIHTFGVSPGAEEPVSSGDVPLLNRDAPVDGEVDAEVEDGEFLSDHSLNDSGDRVNVQLKGQEMDYNAETTVGSGGGLGLSKQHLKEDPCQNAPMDVEKDEDDDQAEATYDSRDGVRKEEELEFDYEDDTAEEVVEPVEDEDAYVIDDDEEDDFAKKLGGFFS